MTATTYCAMTADEQLGEAQRVLDTHVTSSANGRCMACGTQGPCCNTGKRRGDLFADAATTSPYADGDAAGAGRRPPYRRWAVGLSRDGPYRMDRAGAGGCARAALRTARAWLAVRPGWTGNHRERRTGRGRGVSAHPRCGGRGVASARAGRGWLVPGLLGVVGTAGAHRAVHATPMGGGGSRWLRRRTPNVAGVTGGRSVRRRRTAAIACVAWPSVRRRGPRGARAAMGTPIRERGGVMRSLGTRPGQPEPEPPDPWPVSNPDE